MKPILIILPNEGFDPSEAAIPWKVLTQAGETVCFATANGQAANADPLMLSGEGLDIWGVLPFLKKLKLVGLFLRANATARQAYQQMTESSAFRQPITISSINIADFDGIVFPGGHAKTMRPYLESEQIRNVIRRCFSDGVAVKPIAAICHGVLALARTKQANNKSVLFDRTLTALPWAFEEKAWKVGKIVRFWEPNYYRTYLEKIDEPYGYWGTQQEISRNLKSPTQFKFPEQTLAHYKLKTDAFHRDNMTDDRPAWVVRDGNLVTARWPGDAHLFAKTLLEIINEHRGH